MADDEQFSLCWNNFNTNLSAGFHESLIRGDLVDVTLAAEGQLVKAHRLILSVCSPYFRKMFTQMPPNQHAFIFLKDVSHSALKDLIQFMYCGEVNVKQDALPAFISTAEALQIKGLTETGESAPAPPQASQQQQSPAKESTVPVSSGITTIPSAASSPRTKPTMQRVRVQSYKIDSDDGGGSDHEKIVQIATAGSSSSSTAAGPTSTVTGTTQVQIVQTTGQKRTIQQRASLTPLTATTQQSMKRAKLSSDPLEATEPAQIQTVQIVKQITATPTTQQTTEYVEMPIESITKSEPEYADEASEEVEAIDAEHDQDQAAALAAAEQEAADAEADDSANYVEDETYGDMSKYDESYFTEGDDAKAGGSGFGSETYGESGTAADQAAQDCFSQQLKFIKSPWSTPCLVINEFLYNCHSTRGTKMYWRCHNYSRKRKEERCRARCVLVNGRLSALTGSQHNHPPHTDKIAKIKRRNDVTSEPPIIHHILSSSPRRMAVPSPIPETPSPPSVATYSLLESTTHTIDTGSPEIGVIKIEVLPKLVDDYSSLSVEL